MTPTNDFGADIMKFDNYDRLSRSLKILQDGLLAYVEKQIKNHYKEEWWVRGVNKPLASASKDKWLKEGVTRENCWNELDLPQLFWIILCCENWDSIFSIDIGKDRKDRVKNLREIRNRHAHPKKNLGAFTNELTTQYLESMMDLLLRIRKLDEADKIRVLKNKEFQNIPYPRNDTFTGREDMLIEIRNTLLNSDGQGKSRIILTGIGGIGKTQIALEYAYRYQDYYSDGIFWIKSETGFESEFVKVARDFVSDILYEKHFNDNEAIKKFSDYLFDNHKALIIIDNLEELDIINKLLKGVFPSNLSGHMIITSRKISSKSSQNSIDVKGLSPDEAVNLLLSGSSRKEASKDQSQDSLIIQNAQAICASFGYLTLCIGLASAYLEQFPEKPLNEYLRRIKKEGPYNTIISSDSDPSYHIVQYESTISNIYHSQWEALRNPKSKLTLQIMSLFDDLISVPRSLIPLLAGIEDDTHKKIGGSTQFDLVLVELKKWRFIGEQYFGRSTFSRGSDYDIENESPINFNERKREIRYTLHPLIRDFIRTHTIADEKDLVDCSVTTYIEGIRNPEKLNEAIVSKGIDKIIEEIQSINGLLNKASNLWIDIDSSLFAYSSLLKQESHNFRNWIMVDLYVFLISPPEWFNPRDLPGFALQQIFNRLFLGQYFRDANEFLLYMTIHRIPSLCEQKLLVSDSILLERTLNGFIDHIDDMVITQDNQFLITSSESAIIVWDIITGKAIDSNVRVENMPLFTAVNRENQRIISDYEIWEKWVDKEDILVGLYANNSEARSEDESIYSIEHFAASIDFYGSIFIWNTDNGKLITRLITEPDYYSFPANDGLLFSVENDRLIYQNFKEVIIWNTKNWTKVFGSKNGDDFVIGNSILDSDNKLLIYGDSIGNLTCIDIESGSVLQTKKAHEGLITKILNHPHDNTIITASIDGNIKVWNWVNETLILKMCFGGTSAGINDIAIRMQDHNLISGHDNGTLVLWDIATGNQNKILYGHCGPITQVIISKDGSKAFSKSEDLTIKFWNLEQAAAEEGSDDDFIVTGLFGIAVSMNSQYGIGIGSNIAVLYDLVTNSSISSAVFENEDLKGIVLIKDANQAIIYGKLIYRWDYLNDTESQAILINEDEYRSFIFVTSNIKWAVSKRTNCDRIEEGEEHPQDTVEVWDLEANEIICSLNVEPHSTRSFFIDEYGKQIIACRSFSEKEDGIVDEIPGYEYWTINENGFTSSNIRHELSKDNSLISSDGKSILIEVGSGVKEIRDFISGELISSLYYGFSDLHAKYLSVTPDYHYATIIVSDGAIHLWDLIENRCKAVLPGCFVSCLITPDGSKTICIDSLGQVHFLGFIDSKT